MISVHLLNKTFRTDLFKKPRHVLKNVSFNVPQGQATGFVGANGAGKTTTLKCLLGFLKPDSGKILFKDHPLDAEFKYQLGYLPERPYLYEFLTAQEFLKLHWDLGRKTTSVEFAPIMESTLQRVGLKGVQKQRIRSFSKGMMQRLGLAQALLHEPQLLILDEPMSGLDPDGRWLVKKIIQQEIDKGTTVFFSSHLLSDLQELCSHLVAMDLGEVIYSGSMREFIEKAGRPERPDLEEAFIQAQRSFRSSVKFENSGRERES